MKPQPDPNSPPKNESPAPSVSRQSLLWGAGPALACGFWIYALGPRLFELTLGWAGIRTLLLVAFCSGLQFFCAAFLRPAVQKALGGIGWLVAAAALILLIRTQY
jgi:hypothetical protein